jgi:hypothetical protein
VWSEHAQHRPVEPSKAWHYIHAAWQARGARHLHTFRAVAHEVTKLAKADAAGLVEVERVPQAAQCLVG